MELTRDHHNNTGFTVVPQRRAREIGTAQTNEVQPVTQRSDTRPRNTNSSNRPTVMRMGARSHAALSEQERLRSEILSDGVRLIEYGKWTRFCNEGPRCEVRCCTYAHNVSELAIKNCLFGSRCRNVAKQADGKYVNTHDTNKSPCVFVHPDETKAMMLLRVWNIHYVEPPPAPPRSPSPLSPRFPPPPPPPGADYWAQRSHTRSFQEREPVISTQNARDPTVDQMEGSGSQASSRQEDSRTHTTQPAPSLDEQDAAQEPDTQPDTKPDNLVSEEHEPAAAPSLSEQDVAHHQRQHESPRFRQARPQPQFHNGGDSRTLKIKVPHDLALSIMEIAICYGIRDIDLKTYNNH